MVSNLNIRKINVECHFYVTGTALSYTHNIDTYTHTPKSKMSAFCNRESTKFIQRNACKLGLNVLMLIPAITNVQ